LIVPSFITSGGAAGGASGGAVGGAVGGVSGAAPGTQPAKIMLTTITAINTGTINLFIFPSLNNFFYPKSP
jgi:hypothetical protein